MLLVTDAYKQLFNNPSRIIMADSKTCKRKRKPNWTQEQLLLLAQLVNEKDVIKGEFGVGITSKSNTFYKSSLSSNFSKMFIF